MSTQARICVGGGDAGLVEDAGSRLLDLAARWDGAAPDSEITRINSGAGGCVPVSPETVLLVGLALRAAAEAGGRYDPRALPDVLGGAVRPARVAGARWRAGFVVDPHSGAVRVPAGSSLALGGLDRGLAADLVVADALDAGGTGCAWRSGVMCGQPVSHRAEAAGLSRWEIPSLRRRSPACGCVTAPSARARGWRPQAGRTPARPRPWWPSPWWPRRRGTPTPSPAPPFAAGYRTGRALVQAADAAALFCFTDGDVRPTDGWHQFLA